MNGHTTTTTTRRNGISGINVVLGIWLIISPFVLGFTRFNVAEWNDIAVGIAVVLLALAGASWGNIALGIWLIISPFVLGFAGWPTILWNNVILGVLVGIVALSSSSSTRSSATTRTPPTV